MSKSRFVSASSNPVLRQALAIAKSSRERRQAGLSVISGVHLVQSHRAAAGTALHTLVNESALENPEVMQLLQGVHEPVVVKSALFTELSGLVQGGDIVEIIPTPEHQLPELISGDCLILDQLQDPGNLGSILRTAAAAGVRLVITTPGSAFVWSPKVLRAAMGAHFALTVCESIAWETVRERLRVPVWVTSLDAQDSLYAADLSNPVCWVFGNEGAGVSPELMDAANRLVQIPMASGVESLNVAASVAVCLFERVRQRG